MSLILCLHSADEYNEAIRFVSASGIMSTLAGALIGGTLFGPSGNTPGPTFVSSARINSPQGVLSDGAGGALVGGEPALGPSAMFVNCTRGMGCHDLLFLTQTLETMEFAE